MSNWLPGSKEDIAPYDVHEIDNTPRRGFTFSDLGTQLSDLHPRLRDPPRSTSQAWIPNHLATEASGFSPLRSRKSAQKLVHQIFANFGLKGLGIYLEKATFLRKKSARQTIMLGDSECRDHFCPRVTLSSAQNTWGPCENLHLAPCTSIKFRLCITSTGLSY